MMWDLKGLHAEPQRYRSRGSRLLQWSRPDRKAAQPCRAMVGGLRSVRLGTYLEGRIYNSWTDLMWGVRG